MIKIKVFRFEVSNASSSCFEDDKYQRWYKQDQIKLASREYIENCINEFLKDKEFIDLKVSTIDVEYHNNGRGNTIHLLYTLLYKEIK